MSPPCSPAISNSPSPTGWGPPYLLYLGDAHDDLAIKTARGLAFWRPQWCLGQLRGPECKAWLDLPDMSPEAARSAGANTMVVGTANAGGVICVVFAKLGREGVSVISMRPASVQ